MSPKRFTLFTIILVVAISGMSQGLTIPLLTILLDNQGLSSVANGFNATATYLGILLVSPLMEIPLRKLGYRNTIIWGLIILTIVTVLFPVFQSYSIWFILRLILGIGDVALNYSSQMWITDISPVEHRGRNFSLYGLAYGIGFSIGPQGILLLPLGIYAPFLAICVVYAIALLMISRLKNSHPESLVKDPKTNKYLEVVRLAWLPLIPSCIYGFMETSLNSSFPIYILRKGLPNSWVPGLLFTFTVGSLILQLPLGAWSDRAGRKKVMMICASIGALMFILFPLTGKSFWLMALLLVIAGGVVGSFYSLGIAFATDILPPGMIPTAGIITGMNYSVASIVAPGLNGVVLDYLPPGLIFTIVGTMLGLFTVAGFFFQREKFRNT